VAPAISGGHNIQVAKYSDDLLAVSELRMTGVPVEVRGMQTEPIAERKRVA
jgi:hypothetical protein